MNGTAFVPIRCRPIFIPPPPSPEYANETVVADKCPYGMLVKRNASSATTQSLRRIRRNPLLRILVVRHLIPAEGEGEGCGAVL